jgi:hypothetical protein
MIFFICPVFNYHKIATRKEDDPGSLFNQAILREEDYEKGLSKDF